MQDDMPSSPLSPTFCKVQEQLLLTEHKDMMSNKFCCQKTVILSWVCGIWYFSLTPRYSGTIFAW